jgi:hypothetical protein
MSNSEHVYREFEAGEYWDIAPKSRQSEISDRCVQDGGDWLSCMITRWDTRIVGKTPDTRQLYRDPSGRTRRVSTNFLYLRAIVINNAR